jgi:nickel/cobalt transporter (NicO) family protein
MTLGVGMLLGARHAVDADHLVVVATMLERERGLGGALRTAVLWSAGHSCTFLGVGLGIIALGLRVPDAFERAAELAIAFMLIALGFWHWKSARTTTEEKAQRPSRPLVRPIAAGIIHGLAGSAGIALLALTTIPTALGAILYLLAFGMGTVLGMVVSTALLSFPLGLSQRASLGKRRAMTALASAASIGLGLVLVWQSLQKN